MLLVTGANGNLGGAVISHLRRLVAPDRIAVGSRNPQTAFARELAGAGIDVRKVDFDEPETLGAGFRGIEKALIISTYSDNKVRLQQNRNAIDAAKAAGVRHIIYTSFLGARADALAEHSRLVHFPTEQAIIASGMDYTILRHALYAEVAVNDLDDTLASGVLRRCGGDGACAYIARDDLGLSAATVLANPGHENRIYSETMPETKTNAEIADALAVCFGQPIRYEPIPIEEWPGYLMRRWNMPESLALSTVGTMEAIAAGEFDIVSPDYEAITGRPPRSFEQFLEDVKSARSAAKTI